ncbi:MAG: rhodanese-like domain-containing protein [Myxococcales bacterium]|nr:rhodanese-like domain-containing protein [Myxococcales bacterium]
MQWIVHSVVIVLAGSVLGLGLNVASRHPIPLGEAVYATSSSGTAVCTGPGGAAGGHEAHPLMAQGDAVAACTACSAGFVDARGAAAFASGHIPAAVHLPPHGHSDERLALETLRKFATVVVYDSGIGCRLADGVADRLRAEGFQDVRILDGSWRAWMATGGPAESGACMACEAHDHPHGQGGGR